MTALIIKKLCGLRDLQKWEIINMNTTCGAGCDEVTRDETGDRASVSIGDILGLCRFFVRGRELLVESQDLTEALIPCPFLVKLLKLWKAPLLFLFLIKVQIYTFFDAVIGEGPGPARPCVDNESQWLLFRSEE